MTDPFSTVVTELPRDRWGRPLISPPEGGDPVAYQRVTTFVGVLEDTANLTKWKTRMVVLGMAQRRDLQVAATAITDPKDRFQKRTLNDLAESAIEAAKGSEAATIGTALHSLTEQIDAGLTPSYIPEEFEADLAAYRQITEGVQFLDAEGFVVVDHLRVGGSYDRIAHFPEGVIAPDGSTVYTVIWDLKTGGSEGVLFGIGKIAMQLGVYANGVKYDHTLGSRTPLPGDPSKKWGIICHLPAGTGQVQLLWVDVEAGFEVAEQIAPAVHAWRKRERSNKPEDAISSSFRSATATARSLTLPELIAAAPSYGVLQKLHADNRLVWTPGLTSLAKARKDELEKGLGL